MATMVSRTRARVGKTVVVVEDDPDYRLLLEFILSGLDQADLHVVSADSGASALAAIREQPPDLVILDLVLPDMHGWELFLALRENECCADIPVIILSSQGTRLDRSFGLQVAHVHDYLLKPCLPSRLRESVRSALSG